MRQVLHQSNTSPQAPFTGELPPMICFRVTRFCNARCGFCLAPPDGGIHPPVSLLKGHIDWLFEKGVKTIHFCGGEPTIHRDLPGLINYVKERGKKSKLTTNGISMPDKLIDALDKANTQVKISLHGDKDHHNLMVGCNAYDDTTATLRRLLAARVYTSIQTTIVANHLHIVDWTIQFCLDNGIKRVSFLPFIPRGSGNLTKDRFQLSPAERRELRNLVTQKRRQLISRIDIRLLDFNARPIHVVEPDGRVILESATEAMDTLLYQIPSAQGKDCL
jgi:MoaA/NifB/PqqE/SkfB family radical SAM enzyme